MLEQFKAMGALAGLLKDKERLREMTEQFKEKMERTRVTGAAGGGAVRVTISGKLRVTDVQIQPALASSLGASDAAREQLQAMIQEATNDALERVQEMIQAEAARRAQELGLPDMPGLSNLLR